MAEDQGVSSLPLPPKQYIKNYTDERIRNGNIPSPPRPPPDKYDMFGATFQPDDAIIRQLETQGLQRLHPKQFDHKEELKRLNHSILVNFLDLVDILITAPQSPHRQQKVEDINLVFIHMHHLINEFRPHQARETLRVMMEVQKRQRLDTAERFQKHLEKVTESLQNCLESLPSNIGYIESKVVTSIEIEQQESGNVKKDAKETVEQKKTTEDIFYDKDKLMCDMVDSI
ncbi:mediator of RNA polymerase II transcription subunit 7-like [Anneissia japonica]|uniref:mediator of RNA polymerase II transcription subunit 7-like n=1 Tax=Anneissia japonica TaxID=1529436 RepID=UPI00142583FF|nr:mediator of RNA polymerase II transcription subunit 7-like [Anneissia japonica]